MGLQGFEAIVGYLDLAAEAFEHPAGHLLVDGVVFDKKDPVLTPGPGRGRLPGVERPGRACIGRLAGVKGGVRGQGPVEFRASDGLFQAGEDAGIQGLVKPLSLPDPGERHDSGVRYPGIPGHAPLKLRRAHAGHVELDEGQVIRVFERGVPQFEKGPGRVRALPGGSPPARHELPKDAAVRGVLGDDKDTHPREGGHLPVPAVLRGALGWFGLEGDLNAESAPDAGFASDVYIAAHQVRELAGDRQAEAGAAVAPGHGAVGL
nr:hypothetical protein [Rubrobacter indicoceani]